MPASTPQFIHLHLHSAYSLAEGAIKIPDLIQNVSSIMSTCDEKWLQIERG